MEYQSRKVKWYWMFTFVTFCGGVIYLLFTGNPYLYSTEQLRAQLVAGDSAKSRVIPKNPEPLPRLGNPTGLARYNFQRTAIDPVGAARSRAYVEFEKHAVEAPDDFDLQNVTSDATGFVLSGRSPLVLGIDLEGKARWSYRFLEGPEDARPEPGEASARKKDDRAAITTVLDEYSAYLVHPRGEVVCLDKKTGQLRWVLDTKETVAAAAFAWGKDLILPVRRESAPPAKDGVKLLQIHRASGEIEQPSPKLDLAPGFTLAQAPALDALIATNDNKVMAIDPETWKITWSQTLTEPARGPAVISEQHIFLGTPGGKLVRLDGSKRGKLDWDLDLPKPAATPPALLPVMQRLSFVDTSGQLVAVDARNGKLLWRVPIENKNPAAETWSARLKGQNIEEFKMDWLHKGWTIWSPCAEKKVCIYTPNKGQLIERLALTGLPVSLPIALERRWIFLVETKPGHWTVSKLVEEGEVKKLRAAAESAQAD